jgi:hypothetical protein
MADAIKFTEPVPGHWSTDEGTAMANFYAAKNRDELAYGQKTDLELANAIFMADRNDLALIGLQTAAKERIRWLSVQLALALAAPALPGYAFCHQGRDGSGYKVTYGFDTMDQGHAFHDAVIANTGRSDG